METDLSGSGEKQRDHVVDNAEPPAKRRRPTLVNDDDLTRADLELGDDIRSIVTEDHQSKEREGSLEDVDLVSGERRLVGGHSDATDEEDDVDRVERSASPVKYVVTSVAKEIMQDEARHLDFWEWFQKYYPRLPLDTLLSVFDCEAPAGVDEFHELLPLLKAAMTKKTARRRKREDINTVEDVLELLKDKENIMVLTGAGVSVSCGIPDFRSKNGIYSRLDEFELNDPQEMFDIEYFRDKPETFYAFAKEIYPSNFKPSPSHMFIKLLEEKGKLLRNYTQNIDTLEQVAGIKRVVQCHGSFATARCITCKYEVPGDAIAKDIFAQTVPRCPKCSEDAEYPIMKPDIVFFGEKLPDEFDRRFAEDKDKVDLLIVMGSSLKVSPVADVKDKIPHDVPQILINMESLPHMAGFDVQLLGYCDTIVAELCRLLGWELNHEKVAGVKGDENGEGSLLKSAVGESSDKGSTTEEQKGEGEGESGEFKAPWIQGRYPHQYLFEGALAIGDMQPNSWVPDSDDDDDDDGSTTTSESEEDEEGTDGDEEEGVKGEGDSEMEDSRGSDIGEDEGGGDSEMGESRESEDEGHEEDGDGGGRDNNGAAEGGRDEMGDVDESAGTHHAPG